MAPVVMRQEPGKLFVTSSEVGLGVDSISVYCQRAVGLNRAVDGTARTLRRAESDELCNG